MGVARSQSRGNGSETIKRNNINKILYLTDCCQIQGAFGATPPGSTTSAEISSDPKGTYMSHKNKLGKYF